MLIKSPSRWDKSEVNLLTFVGAILDSPHDVSTRLAFAEWLDEQGDPRGEYIRLAVAAGPDSRGVRGRQEELERDIVPGWLPLLKEPPRTDEKWRIQVNPDNLWDASVSATLAGLTTTAAPAQFTLDLSYEGQHDYDDGDYALHFGVFISGGLACVEFEDFDGSFINEQGRQRNLDHWRSRNPSHFLQPRTSQRFLGYPVLRREFAEIHVGWTIPRAEALLALKYHFLYFGHWRNGSNTFAPWVAWERCDGQSLEEDPPTEPRQPSGPSSPAWSGHADEVEEVDDDRFE